MILITTLVVSSLVCLCWRLGAVRLEWCPGCRLKHESCLSTRLLVTKFSPVSCSLSPPPPSTANYSFLGIIHLVNVLSQFSSRYCKQKLSRSKLLSGVLWCLSQFAMTPEVLKTVTWIFHTKLMHENICVISQIYNDYFVIRRLRWHSG